MGQPPRHHHQQLLLLLLLPLILNPGLLYQHPET
jgi:hypothetical protein